MLGADARRHLVYEIVLMDIGGSAMPRRSRRGTLFLYMVGTPLIFFGQPKEFRFGRRKPDLSRQIAEFSCSHAPIFWSE